MTFILYHIEKKLHNSILINKPISNLYEIKNKVVLKNLNDKNISIVLKKLLFNFIYFFSKNLRNKKKNIKNLLLFLNFYYYYNTFFFNNKILFYKKYFSKNFFNTFYLKTFFLDKKQIRLKPSLYRLKAKRIAFFKKHIWSKNKKFRKKNILIFNKFFFKRYHLTRYNYFVADALLHYSKIKKFKLLRRLKKRFLGLLNKKYYYLFLYKRYIFSRPKKRYNKKKLISFNFRDKTYAKAFINKKFAIYRRRKLWKQVYYIRKYKNPLNRILFLGFDTKIMNAIFFNKFKKKYNYSKVILFDYLWTYGCKLAKKYSTDKNFLKKFFSRKTIEKRFSNIMYFFKWKPKTLNFYFFNLLKKNKNLKKNIFSAVLFKFFQRKIFWKKKKNLRAFFLLYYNNFFLNKFFILFNYFFKPKFGFFKANKWRKRKRLKRRRFTKYIKRLRRRIIKKKIKRKFIKFFLILLFFRFMKKHKNVAKVILLKNSFFLSKVKSIKLNFLTSILLGTDSFYFKNNRFLEHNFVDFKKNLKTISLLQKNKA